MNKKLISKCKTLIGMSKDNILLYDDVINEINKNKDLAKYKCTIPNAIEYLTKAGIKILVKNELDSVKNDIIIEPNDTDRDEESIIEIEKDFEDDLVAEEIENEIELEQNHYLSDTTSEENNKTISENSFTEDIIKSYLKEVAKEQTGLLTADEEKDLCIKAQNGDLQARNKMITFNLKLVISIAKRYANLNYNLDFSDIIQSGNIGLLKAIDKFDPNKGFRFSTYATWWIKQSITRAFADEGRTIRIPVHAIEQLRYIKKAIREINDKNGNDSLPEYETIANYCNEHGYVVKGGIKDRKLTADAVQLYMRLYHESDTVSIYIPVGEDEDTTIGELIPDTNTINAEHYVEQNDLRDKFNYVFDNYLSKREADILKLRFGFDGNEPMTLEQVGQIYGITRERVRQLEYKAKQKIKKRYFRLFVE